MSNLPYFERNLGFMTEAEQEKLQNSVVSIAGAGGDGGMLAVQLARMGVQEFRLADPDPFEVENTNRQAVCTTKTIGVNKAEAVAEYVQAINPNASVTTYSEGITEDNTPEFVQGATLVIDETEFTLHALGIMLSREARYNNIPVMTALNIGFGAMVTTFKPNGITLEKMLGFKNDEPLDEIAEKQVSLDRWLPYLPSYVDMKAFAKVAKGEKSAPSIAPGVAMAASMGATQAFLNIAGKGNHRPKPVYAPKALVMDSMTMEAKQVKFRRRSHYKHLAVIGFKNLLKLNPQASY
jgi:molybdopterin/thiamine biosynthesis adenylyltransferase